ncbi:hypothetical protein F8M41_010447 [Gigaspora margarita]|uniref:Uncharacterized protein n=1 Tax=Gigaspora margarita TaxID=4874 RepID=A0A8H3X3V6_GIGMA|nr:hypothetical protein F8M41_010447 [Gigaspora margarita]
MYLFAPQTVNEFAVNIIGDETDSNLINEETGSQDEFTLADDIWSTDTEELQEPNTQVLQTINESDDGWNTDITDELQESDLLTWDFDHLPNSSHLSNSSASSSTINKLDNTDDQISEIIQLGSRGNKKTAGWSEEDTSPPHYFIGCQNYKRDYSYHEDGVNNESNAIQRCYTILPFSTKQNKCRIGCILADEHRGQALGLDAIQRSANFDSHQWSTAITYEKTNVQDSYRNKSSLQRTINSAKRKQKQSTKQSIEPITTKPKKKACYNKESSSNESFITYEQEQLLNIDYKKLSVQKNLNNELEREIRLRQQLKSLFNSETNNE